MIKEKNINFQKLTPYDKVDLGVYKDAIDYIFQNEDVNNVAITGGYGAGKSSIIESYKKNNSDENSKKEFIHVSLADISSKEAIDQNKINELEGKIINSLIQQIAPENIPDSSFRSIVGRKKKRDKLQTRWILVFIFSSFILFNKELMQDIFFIPQTFTNIGIKGDYIFIINFLIWSFISGKFVCYILEYFNRVPLFKRIKVLNHEIELFETQEDDYFNKYLNEIIYLFKQCDVNAIIFEDIDRFNMKEIFIKLREINFLTNSQLINEGKKSLKFIYLLRDDLFETKERTKFFDFIIPVIPIADASNSADYIMELFKDNDYFKSENQKLFLKEISLYIDDMRLIKNIYNEFEIYRNKIGKVLKLNNEKLFAVIVYKNIFPNDFNKFQYNSGYVYGVLQEKKIKKRELILEYEKKSTELWEEFYESQQYIDELDSDFPEEEYYRNSSELIIEEIDEIDNKIKGFKNITTRELIKYKDLNLLTVDIKATNDLNEKYIAEIKNNIYFNLLKFLLLNGYLNEFTREYISYFKEGFLSLSDKIFIKNIKNKTKTDYDYGLQNIEIVLKWIREYDYEHESILNYDLFKYLLENKIKSNELRKMINQIKDSNNQKFIVNFLINQRDDIDKYLDLIAQNYPNFIDDIYSKINNDYDIETRNNIKELAIAITLLSVPTLLNVKNLNETYSDSFIKNLSEESINIIKKMISNEYATESLNNDLEKTLREHIIKNFDRCILQVKS